MKLLLVFLLVVSCALAYPRPPVHRRYSQQRAAARLRRAPVAAAARHRTMLISGYYRPIYAHRRQGFEPETAMTAFATGENVAAGSYLGTGCPSCAEQDNTEYVGAPEPNEEPLSQSQDFPPLDAPLPEAPEAPFADTEVAPPKPVREPKAPVKKPQNDADDVDDEVDDYIPTKGRKPFNTYFPIVFGSGAGRSGANGGSGGVTAIANSYSSGKGGVANSHATAYGSGSAPARRRSKRPQLEAEDADDEE